MAEIVQFDAKSRRDIADTVKQVLRDRPGDKRGSRRYPRPAAGIRVYVHTLTEDMGATTTKTASCTIYTVDGATMTEHATGQTLYDPAGFLTGAVSGTSGPCIKQDGKYYAMNNACGS